VREGCANVRLSDLSVVFTDGDWIESKDQSPTGIRLIQTGNIGIGEFKDRAEKGRYISAETFHRLRCQEIFEGDCLVSRLPDPVGRSCIIPASEERMITAVDCTIIRFNRTKIIPEYFSYFSQSSAYFADVEAACTGATRKRISRKNLGDIEVPLRPLPEQKRIVAILDEAFEGISAAVANAEKNLANARELFESYLNSVFIQRGEGWEQKELGNICEVKDGTHDSPKYVAEGIPFVTQKNIREDGLSFSNTKFISKEDHDKFYKRSNVAHGDILISMIGANRGMACIVDDKRIFSIKNVGLVKKNGNVNGQFLLYL
jgi:type I restriction enzyme S subunit